VGGLTLQDIQKTVGPRLSSAIEARGEEVRVEPVGPGPGPTVADSASTFLIRIAQDTFVLRVAPEHFPDVIEIEQRKAADAKAKLGDVLGSVILQPVLQGRVLDRSYAVLPYRPPFSDSRLLWRWQRWRVKPFLLGWLQSLTDRSPRPDCQCKAVVARFHTALTALAEMPRAGAELRRDAADIQRRIATGDFRPRSILMHGDFWKGNILKASEGKHEFPFVVIDWRGSLVDGFPIFDLVTFAGSYQMCPAELRAALQRHCDALACDLADARSYLLAALGHIAMTLDQFPVDRFVVLARLSLSRCDAALQE
jgi:hypothetical protein